MEQAPAADLPGVGDIMSAGTAVTLDNAGLVLGVWAVCGLPPQLLAFVVGLTTGIVDGPSVKAAVDAGNWDALAMVGAVATVGLALGLLGHASILVLASRALRGQSSDLRGLLAQALGRVLAVVGASVLTGMAVGFGFVFLFLPGLYLMVRLSLAVCATVVEEAGPLDGLRRGWELTSGRFGETLVFLAALICAAFAGMIAVIAAGLLLRFLGSAAGAPGKGMAGLAVNALQFMISAWAASCLTKFFLELAARRPKGA